MKPLITLFSLFLVFSFNFYAQELNIFRVTSFGNDIEMRNMISMSDIYILSAHPDSSAIPDLNEMDESELDYFTLNIDYRTRFLNGTNTTENDSIFIYDYVNNSLSVSAVNSAKVVAMLSPYEIGGEYELTQYEYLIGFEVDDSLINQGNYDENSLVYVGQHNPFVEKKLENIEWMEIERNEIPNSMRMEDSLNITYDKAYKFKFGQLSYFIQDVQRHNYVWAKHLFIIDTATNSKIFDTMYYSGEGSEFNALNSQYTGQLFKDKPEVIFGFNYHSFGCSSITFIDKKEKSIETKCDNRH
ncbi:hypothetical protein ERX46_02640 [Brumimicrobium glaciale]|uniref:Uncharacterized protein n=1 Tax=Brumimicrobium glaciale TaxID=200475 RepID=A0A4Q4KQN0_9FLAO|nr:hypothetical protein [Brumimicrobium glaciale]RYM35908.1 hypothetical protein ERX46_02640 [Brumimicrobium glaciale]